MGLLFVDPSRPAALPMGTLLAKAQSLGSPLRRLSPWTILRLAPSVPAEIGEGLYNLQTELANALWARSTSCGPIHLHRHRPMLIGAMS